MNSSITISEVLTKADKAASILVAAIKQQNQAFSSKSISKKKSFVSDKKYATMHDDAISMFIDECIDEEQSIVPDKITIM